MVDEVESAVILYGPFLRIWIVTSDMADLAGGREKRAQRGS